MQFCLASQRIWGDSSTQGSRYVIKHVSSGLKGVSTMDKIKVRKYRDEDEELVKEIFALGISEQVPTSFVHMLKQPLIQVVLMCVFFGLMAVFKSFLLPVLVISMLLVGMRQLVSQSFTKYIDFTLKEDFSRIQESYMEERDSCFWVAESEGRVVALMAYVPSKIYQEFLELKHVSVYRSHRRRGIAKTLCRVAVDFARTKGYQTIVLYTSVVQTDAQKLYEHIGFKKIRQFRRPTLTAKFTNFFLFEYQLKV
ncbi:probable N-acetyltransferase CML1 isoform X1 [Paramormyrops kingsleyae]|uniref:probable N-acetyltransferase CML1 isoform X1 n=1 Tax=Paramormyrops kingsleyae TaxID=1676925 RepID=UPI000CD5D218|nr:probable N-acetyltransferase CML1 isoform X1 [Paramormyrops kingsleyae]